MYCCTCCRGYHCWAMERASFFRSSQRGGGSSWLETCDIGRRFKRDGYRRLHAVIDGSRPVVAIADG